MRASAKEWIHREPVPSEVEADCSPVTATHVTAVRAVNSLCVNLTRQCLLRAGREAVCVKAWRQICSHVAAMVMWDSDVKVALWGCCFWEETLFMEHSNAAFQVLPWLPTKNLVSLPRRVGNFFFFFSCEACPFDSITVFFFNYCGLVWNRKLFCLLSFILSLLAWYSTQFPVPPYRPTMNKLCFSQTRQQWCEWCKGRCKLQKHCG